MDESMGRPSPKLWTLDSGPNSHIDNHLSILYHPFYANRTEASPMLFDPGQSDAIGGRHGARARRAVQSAG